MVLACLSHGADGPMVLALDRARADGACNV